MPCEGALSVGKAQTGTADGVNVIQKRLSEITKPDIEALITAKIEERRTLDYKDVLPGNSDEQKKEFLYDVSSFANAAGGDLIFGLTD
jgi:predicted HTH transcriptional regulator